MPNQKLVLERRPIGYGNKKFQPISNLETKILHDDKLD